MLFCTPSGCFWWGSKVFWREFQNHASISVLPRVCALCEGIQGKPAIQTPSKWLKQPTQKLTNNKNHAHDLLHAAFFISASRGGKRAEEKARADADGEAARAGGHGAGRSEGKLCCVCIYIYYINILLAQNGNQNLNLCWFLSLVSF